jgi:hypothetical protein
MPVRVKKMLSLQDQTLFPIQVDRKTLWSLVKPSPRRYTRAAFALWASQPTARSFPIGPVLQPPQGRLPSGAIAQLGERFHGMEEVVGSIPSGSTSLFRDFAIFLTVRPNRDISASWIRKEACRKQPPPEWRSAPPIKRATASGPPRVAAWRRSGDRKSRSSRQIRQADAHARFSSPRR